MLTNFDILGDRHDVSSHRRELSPRTRPAPGSRSSSSSRRRPPTIPWSTASRSRRCLVPSRSTPAAPRPATYSRIPTSVGANRRRRIRRSTRATWPYPHPSRSIRPSATVVIPYTIPHLTPGASYNVRLDFAEILLSPHRSRPACLRREHQWGAGADQLRCLRGRGRGKHCNRRGLRRSGNELQQHHHPVHRGNRQRHRQWYRGHARSRSLRRPLRSTPAAERSACTVLTRYYSGATQTGSTPNTINTRKCRNPGPPAGLSDHPAMGSSFEYTIPTS